MTRPPGPPWPPPHGDSYGQNYGQPWPPAGQTPPGPSWGNSAPPESPPTPPNKGGTGKWILGAGALVAVIALTIVGTILLTQPESNSGAPNSSRSNGPSEFASANDTGAATLVTEDPTCAAWNRLATRISDQQKRLDWGSRDKSILPSAWSPDLRDKYQSVSSLQKELIADTVALAKKTPHRTMRELYQQYGVFAEKLSAAVTGSDDSAVQLAQVVDSFTSSLNNICGAISFDLPAAQAPFMPKVDGPSRAATPDESSQPFLQEKNSICTTWSDLFQKNQADTKDWAAIDSAIPATEWTPEQKAVNEDAAVVMKAFADDIETAGRDSDNPVLEDFAVLAAQYRRAYAHAIPTYTPNDNWLGNAAMNLVRAVNSTCQGFG